MIKRLLTSICLLFSLNSFSQILVSYDFTGYDGTVPSIAPGWTISNNDNTAGSAQTYYSTSGSCGLSCPSYKFNITGATIISPTFTNATQLRFFMKGNGTSQPNPFKIYTTTDGTTWNNIQTYNPVSLTGTVYTLSINPADIQVKFEYIKDSLGFNVALDDIIVSNGPVGINQLSTSNSINVYPTISDGPIYFESSNERKMVTISVVNMIGKEVKHLSFVQANGKTLLALNDLPDGIYILKINAGNEQVAKRIIIRR
jgi:hypothetical protein